MICFKLTNNEIKRIQWAADQKGFPWQAIIERPRAARQFLKRVEAETARRTVRTRALPFGLSALAPA